VYSTATVCLALPPALSQGRSAATERGRLFGLHWPLTIAQSHTRTAAVLVDELDTGGFHV